MYYKASEYLTLLLMYLPVMFGILPNEYMLHYTHLSAALFILYQKSITEEQLHLAQHSIDQFCAGYEQLYHLRFQTSNFHNLMHLVEDVKNLGPLNQFDCFVYESCSGQILKEIHGTQNVESQLIRAVSISHKLPQMVADIEDEKAAAFLQSMLGHSWAAEETLLEDELYAVGTRSRHVTTENINFLQEAMVHLYGVVPVDTNVICSFLRFRSKCRVYHCQMYGRVSKRNSVQYIDPHTGLQCFDFVKKCYFVDVAGNGEYQTYHVAHIKCLRVLHDEIGAATHYKVVAAPSETDREMVMFLRNVIRMCVFMKFSRIPDEAFVSLVPNITHVV